MELGCGDVYHLLLVAVVMIMDTLFRLAAPSLYRRRRGAAVSEASAHFVPGGGCACSAYVPLRLTRRPAQLSAAGQDQARYLDFAGWRLRLPGLLVRH